jgi:hypothetical protein
MAFRFYFEPDYRCCFVRFESVLAPGDIVAQMNTAMAQEWFFVGINFLQDLRDASYPFAGYEYFQRTKSLRDAADRALGSCRVALVAGTKADYGILRQLEIMSEGVPVERSVFLDLREAKRWLGVPEGYRIAYPD